MQTKFLKFIAESEDEGKRLLTFLKKHLPSHTNCDLRFAITRQRCKVNGKIERFESTKMKKEDAVEIAPLKKPHFKFELERVLFQDEFLCIYNKPSGIPVTEKEGLSALFSWEACHRLDRDTTGALIFAKDPKTLKLMENLFKEGKIEKSYLAFVHPSPFHDKGIIENHLEKKGHKEGIVKWGVSEKGVFAKTTWRVEKRGERVSLLRCYPITGRTHQIRVHMSSQGHPIVGDVHYGSKNSHFTRPLLHAATLSFYHPITHKKVAVSTPQPDDFQEALELL